MNDRIPLPAARAPGHGGRTVSPNEKGGLQKARGPRRLLALGSLGTILVSAPLMILLWGDQGPDIPLIVALIVFPSVLIISSGAWLMRGFRMPQYVPVLLVAAVCGGLAGYFMFKAVAGLSGLLVTVPLAIIVASVGYACDRFLESRKGISNGLIFGCAILLVASGLSW